MRPFCTGTAVRRHMMCAIESMMGFCCHLWHTMQPSFTAAADTPQPPLPLSPPVSHPVRVSLSHVIQLCHVNALVDGAYTGTARRSTPQHNPAAGGCLMPSMIRVLQCLHSTAWHGTDNTSRHVTPRHATPRHAMSRPPQHQFLRLIVILCHVTSRHATPRHATPRHAMSRPPQHQFLRLMTGRHSSPHHTSMICCKIMKE
jgi:hypothetical protein